MPTESIAMIVGVFLLAGWVKGVVGMGLPTVAMGALGLTMPPVQAAALLVVPSLVTNVWQFVACSRVRPREIESSRSRFASGFWSLWSSLEVTWRSRVLQCCDA